MTKQLASNYHCSVVQNNILFFNNSRHWFCRSKCNHGMSVELRSLRVATASITKSWPILDGTQNCELHRSQSIHIETTGTSMPSCMLISVKILTILYVSLPLFARSNPKRGIFKPCISLLLLLNCQPMAKKSQFTQFLF